MGLSTSRTSDARLGQVGGQGVSTGDALQDPAIDFRIRGSPGMHGRVTATTFPLVQYQDWGGIFEERVGARSATRSLAAKRG